MREIEELKNTLAQLVDSSSDLNILLEFEEVLDNLNIYAYKNWEYGEVLAGPDVSKYWITCSLMWPQKLMPDPDGALRLTKHGARVSFKKDMLIEPIKIVTQDDLSGEPGPDGKRRAKKKQTPIWIVNIEMPRQFVDEFESSKITINGTDIDLSEVDGAYNTDQDLDLTPEKSDVLDDIGEQ